MKSRDLFCASPASTAICSSTDQRRMVRQGTRPIERRQSHHLGDKPPRIRAPVPCSVTQLPLDPRPYYHKARNSFTKHSESSRRKSSADITDLATPRGSARYLLTDTPFIDFLSDSEKLSALVPVEPASKVPMESLSLRSIKVPSESLSGKMIKVRSEPSSARTSRSLENRDEYSIIKSASARLSESPVYKPSSPCLIKSLSDHKSSSTRFRPGDQVVELMVSIHCKGCEGKVRKHIARMEGVTSYSIDLETKKVTIVGDVTPLGVLTSISKVKNAQFWPSSPSSSSSSTSTSTLTSS